MSDNELLGTIYQKLLELSSQVGALAQRVSGLESEIKGKGSGQVSRPLAWWERLTWPVVALALGALLIFALALIGQLPEAVQGTAPIVIPAGK